MEENYLGNTDKAMVLCTVLSIAGIFRNKLNIFTQLPCFYKYNTYLYIITTKQMGLI